MKEKLTRRSAMKGLAAAGAAAFVAGQIQADDAKPAELKGNIRQSVSRGYSRRLKMEIGEFCDFAKSLGLQGLDLVGVDDWQTVVDHGMTVAIGSAGKGLSQGVNDLSLHEELIRNYEELIPIAAKLGVPNLICFPGNRNGLDDETGLKNCEIGLKKVLPLAEKHGVNLCMELLNSKVNHPDYQCDHSVWGVELCKMLGSERFGLLYDIYHMQIMEGDIIRTIRDNHQYFLHYHTAGNPGRHELDDTQELYYPAIMRAIVETGYKGFVAHEFGATWDDPVESLKHAIKTCDV